MANRRFGARLLVLVAAAGIATQGLGQGPVVRAADPTDELSRNEQALQDGDGGAALLADGGAIISNGTVQLGVRPEGHLNVAGGTLSSGGTIDATTDVGLRFVPTNMESLAPGCLCEGWGAADATSGVTGYANVSTDGVVGLTLLDFTSTATTATSVVQIGSTLKVTHAYLPTTQPNLYQAAVTIENIGSTNVDPRYRRVMDWDVEPTVFSEHVTNVTGGLQSLLYDNNDGFATANPLGDRISGDSGVLPIVTGDFTDEGPRDHGALFDFGFGLLTPGTSITFRLYYGAAGTEAAALAALQALGITTYSLAQTETLDGKTLGTPNTFIFGFGYPIAGDIPAEPAPPSAEPQENNGESRDPVGTFSGDFRYSFTDVAIAGLGPTPAVARSYNSADTRIGPMGPGWTHNYAVRLRRPSAESEDLLFVGADGNTDRYEPYWVPWRLP